MPLPTIPKGLPFDVAPGGQFPQVMPAPRRIVYDTTAGSQYGAIYVTWSAVMVVANAFVGPVEIYIRNGSAIPAGSYTMPPTWYLTTDKNGTSVPTGVYFSNSPIELSSECGATLAFHESGSGSTFTHSNPLMTISGCVITLGTNGQLIDGTTNQNLRLRNTQITTSGQTLMTGSANVVTALEQTVLENNLLPASMEIFYDATSHVNSQNGNTGIGLAPSGAPPDASVVPYEPGTPGNWQSPPPANVAQALDDLAVLSPNIVYFGPGGFETFSDAVAYAATRVGFVWIYVTFPGSTITIPPGTYTMPTNYGFYSPTQALLEVASSTSVVMSGGTPILDGVGFINNGTTPIFTVLSGPQLYNCQLTGSSPVFQINNTGTIGLVLDNVDLIGLTGHEVAILTDAATINLQLSGGSTVGLASVKGATGFILNVSKFDSASSCFPQLDATNALIFPVTGYAEQSVSWGISNALAINTSGTMDVAGGASNTFLMTGTNPTGAINIQCRMDAGGATVFDFTGVNMAGISSLVFHTSTDGGTGLARQVVVSTPTASSAYYVYSDGQTFIDYVPLGSAASEAYTPSIPGDWSPAPTTVAGALDQLATEVPQETNIYIFDTTVFPHGNVYNNFSTLSAAAAANTGLPTILFQNGPTIPSGTYNFGANAIFVISTVLVIDDNVIFTNMPLSVSSNIPIWANGSVDTQILAQQTIGIIEGTFNSQAPFTVSTQELIFNNIYFVTRGTAGVIHVMNNWGVGLYHCVVDPQDGNYPIQMDFNCTLLLDSTNVTNGFLVSMNQGNLSFYNGATVEADIIQDISGVTPVAFVDILSADSVTVAQSAVFGGALDIQLVNSANGLSYTPRFNRNWWDPGTGDDVPTTVQEALDKLSIYTPSLTVMYDPNSSSDQPPVFNNFNDLVNYVTDFNVPNDMEVTIQCFCPVGGSCSIPAGTYSLPISTRFVAVGGYSPDQSSPYLSLSIGTVFDPPPNTLTFEGFFLVESVNTANPLMAVVSGSATIDLHLIDSTVYNVGTQPFLALTGGATATVRSTGLSGVASSSGKHLIDVDSASNVLGYFDGIGSPFLGSGLALSSDAIVTSGNSTILNTRVASLLATNYPRAVVVVEQDIDPVVTFDPGGSQNSAPVFNDFGDLANYLVNFIPSDVECTIKVLCPLGSTVTIPASSYTLPAFVRFVAYGGYSPADTSPTLVLAAGVTFSPAPTSITFEGFYLVHNANTASSALAVTGGSSRIDLNLIDSTLYSTGSQPFLAATSGASVVIRSTGLSGLASTTGGSFTNAVTVDSTASVVMFADGIGSPFLGTVTAGLAVGADAFATTGGSLVINARASSLVHSAVFSIATVNIQANCGSTTLSNGVSSVISAYISPNSNIVATHAAIGSSTAVGVLTAKLSDRVPGTPGSFKITSINSTGTTATGDQSTVDWQIL